MVARCWLIALVGVALAAPRWAQAQPEPPTLVLFRGVCLLADTTLQDAAATQPALRVACPPIVYNPHVLSRIPPGVGLWILLHEYAHVALHASAEAGRASRAAREAGADCAATQAMRELWPAHLPAVLAWFRSIPPGAVDTVDHGSPATRAARVEACSRP